MKTFSIDDIAKVCHEANRAYCNALGDYSQPIWDKAPMWQKDSAVDGVKFKINNPDASPSSQHDNWLEEKRKEGWKYGPIKDSIKKEHPCFLPYNDLPKEQKAKDILFGSIVLALKVLL
jgi:hypothetical protein